jgi:hypothetical protein
LEWLEFDKLANLARDKVQYVFVHKLLLTNTSILQESLMKNELEVDACEAVNVDFANVTHNQTIVLQFENNILQSGTNRQRRYVQRDDCRNIAADQLGELSHRKPTSTWQILRSTIKLCRCVSQTIVSF